MSPQTSVDALAPRVTAFGDGRLRNILGFDESVRPLRYHCIALALSTLDALTEQRPPWQIARRHHLQAPKQTLTGEQTSGTVLDFHNCKIKMSVI